MTYKSLDVTVNS